jgi:nucleoside-diphosphate-sugar epimerase
VNSTSDFGPRAPGRRVLVTGGFGFLGGHILKLLLSEPDVQLHVVDNLSSNPVALETLLAELGDTARLTFDLCSIADYFAAGADTFDAIIHLASPVGPAGVLKHGGRIVAAVVDDCYTLADYALERTARLLDVSTSEVYGGGRDGLCDEEDAKIVPAETSFRLEYAVAKLSAETALINLHARDGLDVVIIRPFNIAGPRQSGEGGFVLPRFLAQAMLGLPLTIFGTGDARRAFTHVNDIANGIVQALECGTAGVAYNLGNPRNIVTVNELADIVLEVTGSDVPKHYIDPTEIYGRHFAEANDKFPSATRATAEFGWSPTLNVRDVVAEAYEYMKGVSRDDFARLAGGKVIEQLLESQPTKRV